MSQGKLVSMEVWNVDMSLPPHTHSSWYTEYTLMLKTILVRVWGHEILSQTHFTWI